VNERLENKEQVESKWARRWEYVNGVMESTDDIVSSSYLMLNTSKKIEPKCFKRYGSMRFKSAG